MTYIHVKNNTIIEYPVYEGEIKLRFPNTSFPIPFSPPDEYHLVCDVLMPSVDHTQNVTEGTPNLIDGTWTRVWNITDASEEEISLRTEQQSNLMRDKRNKLLVETDWTQLKDSPLDSDLWKIYRQKLRDITIQENFPWQIEWPEKPVA